MLKEVVDQRRAVEALRAGVPNRDVVRFLPPVQHSIEERFEALLTATGDPATKPLPGLLLEGDFGTGKSHWLEFFRHRALEANFVCSTVALNKETPLHDMNKVYRACVESAAIHGKSGPAMEEIAHAYDGNAAPGYLELHQWVHQHMTTDVDPRLAATLFLFDHAEDEDLRAAIVAEWTGYPMKVGDLKRALKEAGQGSVYPVGRPMKMNALRRFEFLARFFRSAGYAGWVILVDEMEMAAKYTLRQRGKSYAHMAQILGFTKAGPPAGVAAVCTITTDYGGQVLRGRKNDMVNIPARMAGTKEDAYVAEADAGMRAIDGGRALDLRPMNAAQLRETHDRARDLYSKAYAWDAPAIEGREYSTSTRMRQYLRSWITIWDLRRLYDTAADMVAEDVSISYEEDLDFQSEAVKEDDEPFITT